MYVESSATLQLFRADRRLFSRVLGAFDSSLTYERERMLDMGCGYGVLSKLLGEALGFKEVYGIDIDEKRALVAGRNGMHLSNCNLEQDHFPFPSDYFDFITTFGVLDHLKSLDNPISEAHRVLKSNGCLAISTPNLGSWVNRIALLLGYQPRNLEISRQGLFGVHKLYRESYSCTEAMGRITGFTLRALEEYLRSNGFATLRRWGAGLFPQPDRPPGVFVKLLDKLLSQRPSLAVRYIILARKVE